MGGARAERLVTVESTRSAVLCDERAAVPVSSA